MYYLFSAVKCIVFTHKSKSQCAIYIYVFFTWSVSAIKCGIYFEIQQNWLTYELRFLFLLRCSHSVWLFCVGLLLVPPVPLHPSADGKWINYIKLCVNMCMHDVLQWVYFCIFPSVSGLGFRTNEWKSMSGEI